jgi:cell division protein FtsB
MMPAQAQQNVWAEELRRADDRALKFKNDVIEAERMRSAMEARIKELSSAVMSRDQEIQRLTMLYKGGQNFDSVKLSFDKHTSQETIDKLQKQNEFVNEENHRLSQEMQEIKELLGVCETRDPTDKDRAHLKKLVRELKQRNDSMTSEVKDLERVVE